MVSASRRIKTIFGLMIFILAFTTGCAQNRSGVVKVERGEMNLEHWDFESQGTVRLNGEWEFYWMRLLGPQDLNHIKYEPEYIEVPSTWGNGTSAELANTGYATYRMKINLDSNQKGILGIRLNPVYTACKLWVNGELCAEVGRVGPDPEGFYAKLLTKTVFFNAQPENELVLQVANMEYARAGLLKGPELGTQEQLLGKRDLKAGMELFSTGAIFIMAFYHFGLYLYRRKDLSPLYFGGFCLLIGTRTLLVGETLFNYLAPGIGLDHELYLHSLILYLSPLLFVLFFDSLYPGEISRRVVKSFAAVSVLGLILSFLSGTRYYGPVLYVFELVLIILIFYLTCILIKILVKRREGSVITAAGTMVLLAFTLNDILMDYEIINTGYITSFGLVIFIFSQSYILAVKFSKAFAKVEDLSAELELHNQTLEQNVRERTMDLEETNRRLQGEIEERKRAEEIIRHMAYHDSLTGLPNRKYFVEKLREELLRAKRNNELLSVMFMDLNNFKHVNDNYGHKTGDLLLKEVAGRVKSVLRASDIVGRFGGDEFTVLLTGMKRTDDAQLVAKKILNAVREPLFVGTEHFIVEASIGVSFYPVDGDEAEELIKKADLAMYTAKRKSDCKLQYYDVNCSHG